MSAIASRAGPGVVLRTVLAHGPVARSTIARLTGLSPAAVSRHCAGLLEHGLIAEVGRPPERGVMGRPHVPLDIDVARHAVGGVHIAHEHSTLAVLDLRGRVLEQRLIPHQHREPRQLLSSVATGLREFLRATVPERMPLAVGVAVGGWVDSEAGVLVEHSSLGWRNVRIRELFAEQTGLPVRTDSHARALAQAERLFGAARAGDSVLHLFVGNVVDAAIVTGGQTHRGWRSAAGGLAHLPLGEAGVRCRHGHDGCLEATVADTAWAQRAAGVAFAELLDAARSGDPGALELFVARAKLVGRAAALLFDLVSPEVLVVTEGGVLYLPECLAALRAEVGGRSLVCADPRRSVLPSSFDPDRVLAMAAGAVSLDAMYTSPLVPASGRT